MNNILQLLLGSTCLLLGADSVTSICINLHQQVYQLAQNQVHNGNIIRHIMSLDLTR